MNWLFKLLGIAVATPMPFGDTRGDQENWVEKEPEVYHIRFYNNMGRTVKQGEMVIAVPWCGIADQDIPNHTYGTIYVQESILVQSRRIAAGSTFAQGPESGAIATPVWYDQITRNYHDTQDAGRYLVGHVRTVTDVDGMFAFEKVRYVVAGIES